ncbi:MULTISPECIES: pectate lyase-like adhesive domain-containing protein [Roseburia]|jgi:hypothetical protein|uniref:pectate lyase-like adhesive domain-containing protein n=1 Tax=Roseburia TaxID=841 RepID=UPI001D12F97D|nr:pectate lyase-like adhesive domain-containing protein [Roseburia sp. CLA-AA-H209]MCC2223872.1 hypothetical protein [Roseburia sp. CLA-AA-H209]
MKKRLFSILLALCMVLCLVPTTAFAESETEEPPVCTCETACTAEAMNADCPICGVEGALPENCVKCAQPADDAAVQPEGEVSDPQPETALTALIGGNETAKEVSNESELTAAIADSTVGTVKLAGDISISSSLTVNRTVTLDLNGHVLKYESANKGSVIVVENGGQLTIEDSNTSNLSHKFMPNGKLWVLDEASGTETVTGGVITGGTGYPFTLSSGTVNCGGGVYIAPGGQLTMTGGNIIGCSAEFGGGVCIYPRQNGEQIQFSMSGGSIIGCVASDIGGGVGAYGTFKMSGPAVIRSCAVESADNFVLGGGVFVDGSFEMSGEATIKGCHAISDFANGGGVFVNSSRSFVMSNEAKIENCQAISNSSRGRGEGGGVYLANNTKFTLSGSAVIQNCTATNSANHGEAYGGGVSTDCVKEITLADSARIVGCTAANGSGLYITGSQVPGYGILHANGGSVDGDVVLGDTEDGPCTITGSGGTVFNGKVTVTPGSTIESGTFNGEVINNGTITGGVFNNTVSGSGTITGGTFNTPMTGSGTENDPYQIGTAEQLKLFRDIVNGSNGQKQDRGACAVLTNDIVLNDGTFAEDGSYTPGPSGKTAEEWTPIGRYTDDGNKTPYTGTFDGKHYAIKGLYVVNLPDLVVGLFGGLEGAAVRNLTVDGYVQGCHAVSGIAGDASANSTIENCRNNCRVVSEFVTGRSSSYLYVGGIVGFAEDTTIVGCVNTGVVEARGSYKNSRASKAAGIVCTLCGNVIVKNCYNTGDINVTSDKMKEGTAGGIAGNDLSARNTVSDCYNLGAVTVSYTGNDVKYIAKAGGIMGYIFYSDTTVSNCYSVGTLTSTTGTGTSYIGGVVGITKGTVGNCYYLDSTATKAVWNDGGTVDEATGPKTAAQLGNGTVLALLINSRADSEHPWNSQCQYMAAAGKTLPVFKTQTGDKHTHNWSVWTSNDDGTHSRRCTCNAVETENCSGGMATCIAKAVCEFCKAEYGEKLPHGFTAETVDAKYLKSAATCTEKAVYYKSCAVCGLSSEGTADEATFFSGNALDHDWGAWTQNSDEKTHTRICKRDTSHTETENCHGGTATCTAKAVCEICKASYGSPDPNNHTDLKHIDAKAATVAEEGNIAYWYCDGCKKYFSDAAAIKEITKAATVTAKLPGGTVKPSADKSPQTGDNSNLLLWIALLFISGGAAIGTTVVSRKKKYNR